MNIYPSNTYRKDLSWLHFDNESSRVLERELMKDQQLFWLIQQFQVATRATSPDMRTVFHAWPYGGFIEIQSNLRRKKLHRTNQGSNFLGSSFNNRDNVRAPIHFHINSTSVFRPVKGNQLIFCSIEINKPLLVVATEDQMPDHIQIREQYHQHTALLQITLSGRSLMFSRKGLG